MASIHRTGIAIPSDLFAQLVLQTRKIIVIINHILSPHSLLTSTLSSNIVKFSCFVDQPACIESDMHLEQSNYENLSAEVETYLLHKYRDALSKGDKASAKSCLLAARYFSVNDQDVTNEICLMGTPAGDREDYLISTLRFLGQKLIDMVTDNTIKVKLEEIRSLVLDESELDIKFYRIISIIETLDLKEDIPDDILFSFAKQEANSEQQPTTQLATPPPKARGRPKKTQPASVIVSLDEGMRRHKFNKSRECRIVFYSIVEFMLINCSKYLKSISNRILVNLEHPLLESITDKVSNLSSARERNSQSKTAANSQSTNDKSEITSPMKKPKLEDKTITIISQSTTNFNFDPMHEQGPMHLTENQQVLVMLTQSHKCLEFLNSNYGVFTKLWNKFYTTNNISTFNWFTRFQIDSLILSSKYREALELIDNSISSLTRKDIDLKPVIDSTNSQVVSIPSAESNSSVNLMNVKIRYLVQSISCCIQITDKQKTLSNIDDLLSTMEIAGLLSNDVCLNDKDSIIAFKEEYFEQFGFLLSDPNSLIRYCIDILRSIHKKYAYDLDHASDTTIGHAIVLSQFDWPEESQLYDYCISWIRSHKPKSATPQTLSANTKFTYNEFFLYIRNQNVIEDFMALLNHGFTLDLKGTNSSGGSQTRSVTGSSLQNYTANSRSQSGGTSTRSSKMITTRGVNKTFKEDLKVALMSQMRNSTIVIPLELIAKFLRDSLIPYIDSFET